jgi:DNA-binding NtrC family response regulator
MNQFRPERIPLYVPVVTSSGLTECWSENISSGGVLVVAKPGEAGAPQRGQHLRLQLALPDQSTIDATGEVMWVLRRDPGTVALGLAWRDIEPSSAARITRLSGRPAFRVVVVAAPLAWRARLTNILGHDVAVEFVDGEHDIPGFDVAVVVRCDRDVSVSPSVTLGEGPRQIVVDGEDVAEVRRLLRAGKLGGVIAADDDDDVIADVIGSCCREWSGRQALRRTALSMARALHEQRHTEDATTHLLQTKRTATPSSMKVSSAPLRSDELVADSPAMQDVLKNLAVVAPRKVVVLIEGETGSGKEMIAKTLHQQSGRSAQAFIVQDCGTLTETLLDSELFGHVRGAFTGANADHPGIFVIADGGTVFLDEIQNTSPALQAKLLRVIETGEVRPVGGSRTRVTDVRVVAAANTDLEAAVNAGRFRADLFYRLTVFPVRLPPLRERGRDILTLASRLAATSAKLHGLLSPTLSPDAIEALLAYGWPGNVRQLKNVLERAVLLADDGVIELRHLPDALQGGAPALGLDAQVQAYEKRLIADALAESGGVVVRAAQRLGVNRVTLARKIRSHALSTTSPV